MRNVTFQDERLTAPMIACRVDTVWIPHSAALQKHHYDYWTHLFRQARTLSRRRSQLLGSRGCLRSCCLLGARQLLLLELQTRFSRLQIANGRTWNTGQARAASRI